MRTPPRRRSGFTVIELLVVVLIIVVLVGLVATVVSYVREEGRKVGCQNNQKQLGIATFIFAGKARNGMRFPQFSWTMEQGYWLEQMQGYYGWNFDITYCPSDARPFPMADAKYWPMRLTTRSDPWWDPEIDYLKRPEDWDPVQLSYRGSCDGHREGGYGPKMFEYLSPSKTMLLDEAWDNTRWDARQCSRGPDIWPGYPLQIDWERNWGGLTRHSGGSNFLFQDGAVRWIDAYSGPSRLTFFPDGSFPENVDDTPDPSKAPKP